MYNHETVNGKCKKKTLESLHFQEFFDTIPNEELAFLVNCHFIPRRYPPAKYMSSALKIKWETGIPTHHETLPLSCHNKFTIIRVIRDAEMVGGLTQLHRSDTPTHYSATLSTARQIR